MAAGIIVALILVVSIVLGLFQGGLRTFWSVGCSIAAIVLSMTFNSAVSDFMNNQVHLNQYIEKSVESYLETQAEENLDLKEYMGVQEEANLEEAPAEVQNQYIEYLNLPSSWKKTLIKNNTVEGYGKLLVGGFFEYIASAIAAMSVKVISFLVTFVLVWVVLKAISIMFKIVDKIPLLSQANRLVGAGAGMIRGLLIIWLIMIAIAFIGNYNWGQWILEQALTNPITAFFYYHNLLARAFMSVF